MNKTKYGRIMKVFGGLGIAFCLLLLCFWGYQKQVQQRMNETIELVSHMLNKELTYAVELRGTEETRLIDWLDNAYITNKERGEICERLSNLYRLDGDILNYYKYLGYALYFLNSAGAYETAANIYADLSRYFIQNFEFDKAQNILDQIYSNGDVAAFHDLQIKNYIYRLQGILYLHDGRLEEALEQLETSTRIIDQSHSDTFESYYYAMNDAYLANIYYAMGDYDKCQSILDKYADSDLFTISTYRQYVVSDFVLPYYEAAYQMAVHQNEYTKAVSLIYDYSAYCQEFSYTKNQLEALLYLLQQFPPERDDEVQSLHSMISHSYLQLVDELSNHYSELASSYLENSIKEVESKYQDRVSKKAAMRENLVIACISVAVLFVITSVFLQSRVDSLTKIKNRKGLNDFLQIYRWTRRSYSVIMLDIDDFKRVNDTYGHGMGDEVLQALGLVLRSCQFKGIKAFRYGGEEFIVLIQMAYANRVLEIAEHIRSLVETHTWPFESGITISLGVAAGEAQTQLIRAADDNLYFAKANGKNVVAYQEDGVQKLYRRGSIRSAPTS